MRPKAHLAYAAALLVATPVALATAGMVMPATSGAVRSIFMNGTDISSARNQELKNVDVVINERGDIFINAPHYQVNEEETYLPLSKYVQGASLPQHKPMQKIDGKNAAPAEKLKNEPATKVPEAEPEAAPAANPGQPSADAVGNGDPALIDKPGQPQATASQDAPVP